MADKLKNLIPNLGKRGPYHVLTGDLSFAGIPGQVYVPEEGTGIPGVAFGHDWRLGVEAYHATLRHIASWGIAVAAPDTEKGWLPNHRGFAADMETTLQILAGVRLGQGNVTVHPKNLFFAGHGMGASAAVLAASERESRGIDVAGVIAVFPADTSPSAYDAAKFVDAPGLVLEAGDTLSIPSGNARRLAANWRGEVIYRKLLKASSSGFHEKLGRRLVAGSLRPQYAQQELVRALMAGFILAGEEKKYQAFRERDAQCKGTQTASAMELFQKLPEHADVIESLNSARA